MPYALWAEGAEKVEDLPEAPRGCKMGLSSSGKQEWERNASISKKSSSVKWLCYPTQAPGSCKLLKTVWLSEEREKSGYWGWGLSSLIDFTSMKKWLLTEAGTYLFPLRIRCLASQRLLFFFLQGPQPVFTQSTHLVLPREAETATNAAFISEFLSE